MARENSFQAFCRRFPDEDACLKMIFSHKYGTHAVCPYCNQVGQWGQIKGTKKYFHSCRKQVSLLRETVFYRSNLPLSACFYAFLLFSNSSSGIRTSFLVKHMGLLPKSAHRLSNRIRLHMAACDRPILLGGYGKRVEVDEVFLRHIRVEGSDRLAGVCVVGLACEGKVITGIARDRKRTTLHEIVVRYVAPGSTIVTDDWKSYKGLENYNFTHVSVNHSIGFFNENGFSTSEIDSYWATLRRALRGYHQISEKNLWLYIAESELRCNFRHDRAALFDKLISHWPSLDDKAIIELERRFDWRG